MGPPADQEANSWKTAAGESPWPALKATASNFTKSAALKPEIGGEPPQSLQAGAFASSFGPPAPHFCASAVGPYLLSCNQFLKDADAPGLGSSSIIQLSTPAPFIFSLHLPSRTAAFKSGVWSTDGGQIHLPEFRRGVPKNGRIPLAAQNISDAWPPWINGLKTAQKNHIHLVCIILIYTSMGFIPRKTGCNFYAICP